jgi:hypothetical protein
VHTYKPLWHKEVPQHLIYGGGHQYEVATGIRLLLPVVQWCSILWMAGVDLTSGNEILLRRLMRNCNEFLSGKKSTDMRTLSDALL